MRWAAGFMTGVAATATAALIALVVFWTPDLEAMLAEFRSELPAPTRLALWPGWRVGAPLALIAAAFAGNLLPGERTRAIALGLVAAAAVGAVLFTLWAGDLPLWSTAAAIRVE